MQSNEMKIKAKDGTYIPVVTYNAVVKAARGIIIVCHGFGEHSDSYKEFAGFLTREGYTCVIFDQRGHGKLSGQSPEKRIKACGVIPGYQSFLDDIDTVVASVKECDPNVPLVLYGHSMGGNIAVNYLLRHTQSDFSCAVLEAPWLGLHEKVRVPPACLIKALGNLLPNVPIPKEFTNLPLSGITSDENRQKEISDDQLYHNRMTFRMFSDIYDGCLYALNNASQLSIPTFLAIAQEEKIVSNKAVNEFMRNCGTNVTDRKYESHHSIHNDINREKFYQDLFDFLNAHCPEV